MVCNGSYQNLIERLKERAKTLAIQIGFNSFDVDLAEEDFKKYLRSGYIDDTYPLFGGISSLTDYVERMKYYSGTGNPFSPIIYAGSELASNLQDDRSLYFKICADLYWKEIFDIPLNCPFALEHIKRKFLEKWGGANEDKFNSFNCLFYRTLREHLINNPQFAYDYPFVVYQTLYHTKRKGRHEWNVAKSFLSILLLTGQEEYYNSKPLKKIFQEPNQEDKFIDEMIFMTECNLKPAATGVTNDSQLNQFVFFCLLDNFKQKRIVILHPAEKNDAKTKVKEELNGIPKIANLRYEKTEKCIEIYYYNGHKIIFSPRNLSANVSNNLLCDLSYVTKKKSLRQL
ncbi:MAG: hypothetical protein M0022_05415 [Desulfobacteraceae bacterium]|nr:hypothetical protein [Desulfobacteraceae bacterium]